VDPVPDPLLLRKNLVAPGIKPGPLNLYPETLTTRPQRQPEIIARDCNCLFRKSLVFIAF
jgi:hypothetical protein